VLHAEDTKFVLGMPIALPTTSATTISANAKANEYLISNDIWIYVTSTMGNEKGKAGWNDI